MTARGDVLKNLKDVAVEVVIDRQERSYAFGEPRVTATAALGATGADISPEAVAKRVAKLTGADTVGDRIAIRKVVENFEHLKPTQVASSLGKLTLKTYTSIANGHVKRVDKAAVTEWMKSDVFRRLAAANRDKSDLLEFSVTLTDESTATATYTIAQGKSVGTSSVILIKEDGTWRIAVHCQHPVTG